MGRDGPIVGVTRVWAGGFYLLYSFQTGHWTPKAYYSVHTGVLLSALSSQGVNLTTHLHPVSRLRMTGAISPRLIRLHVVHGDVNFTFTLDEVDEGRNCNSVASTQPK